MKELADEFLNAKIQQGHHSSIIDARIALALYRTFQLYIEQEQPNIPAFVGKHHAPQAQMTSSTAQDLFLIGSGGLECLNMSPIPINPVNNGSPMLDLGTVSYGNGPPMHQQHQAQDPHGSNGCT